jgi:hypothetical protein
MCPWRHTGIGTFQQFTFGFTALVLYSINENLVLWARSEIIGSAGLNKELLNPKHEIRKAKQYRMTKIKMIQTKDIAGIAM